MKNPKVRILTYSAILIAMSTVLSFIKIYQAPYGGSVTLLAMLPVSLVGLMFGVKWGFGAAFVFSVIQLIAGNCFAWGLTPAVLVVCILFDYIIPYTFLGVTGFFKSDSRIKMLSGVGLAVVLRTICHYVTGVSIWKESMPEEFTNVYLYSAVYNGFYMIPELIFTVVGTLILLSIPQFYKSVPENKL